MSTYSRTATTTTAACTFTTSGGQLVQFAKEIRQADGSRLLIVRPCSVYSGGNSVAASLAYAFAGASFDAGNPQQSQKSSKGYKKGSIGAFYQLLCGGAPEGWTCVKLSAEGGCEFHTCPPDSSLLEGAVGVPHPTLHNAMRTSLVDAETKSTVSTYKDGRIVISYIDGRRECRFGDGTIITAHSSGSMVSVRKPNLPAVEMDVEIDAVSRQHARGIEVPINKGGERVRSRIALPDGTAVLVSLNNYFCNCVEYLTR